MNILGYALTIAAACAPVFAALPVVPGTDQAAMLRSKDKKLAANKKVAYDFFRIVLRGLRLDEADKYMTNDYMQHNPNAETGMAGFKAYFNANKPNPLPPIPETLPGLVAIQAEGDYVTLSFVPPLRRSRRPGQEVHNYLVRYVPDRERQDRRALGFGDQGRSGSRSERHKASKHRLSTISW